MVDETPKTFDEEYRDGAFESAKEALKDERSNRRRFFKDRTNYDANPNRTVAQHLSNQIGELLKGDEQTLKTEISGVPVKEHLKKVRKYIKSNAFIGQAYEKQKAKLKDVAKLLKRVTTVGPNVTNYDSQLNGIVNLLHKIGFQTSPSDGFVGAVNQAHLNLITDVVDSLGHSIERNSQSLGKENINFKAIYNALEEHIKTDEFVNTPIGHKQEFLQAIIEIQDSICLQDRGDLEELLLNAEVFDGIPVIEGVRAKIAEEKESKFKVENPLKTEIKAAAAAAVKKHILSEDQQGKRGGAVKEAEEIDSLPPLPKGNPPSPPKCPAR